MNSLYRPLDNERAEFRLLKLYPDQSINSQVSCTLVSSSLQSGPVFEALSYCWGDPSVQKAVTLNGIECKVTTNLEAALRHLRHSSEERTLWVDAICINQNDVQERNSQVMLMKMIYSSAKVVRIWLGETSDASDDVMRVVNTIATGCPDGSDRQQQEAFFRSIQLDGQHLAGGATATSRSWKDHVSAFFTRPWWSRVWILQETILAKEAIVHCGQRQLPMDAFFEVEEIFLHLDTTFTNRDLARSFGTLIVQLAVFKNLRELKGANLPSKAGSTTLRILAEGWRQAATDQRDKVYGLLGLTPELNPNVELHYEWSIENVYTQFCFHIISVSQSLCPFEFVSSVRNPMFQLPSWVPDWSVFDFGKYFRVKYGSEQRWNICGDLPFCAELVSDTVIRIRGIVFNSIVKVGDPFSVLGQEKAPLHFSEHPRHQYKIFLKWQEVCGLASMDDTTQAYTGGGALRTAFWQTLSQGLTIDLETGNPRFCRAGDADVDLFLRMWHKLAGTTADLPSSNAESRVDDLQSYLVFYNQGTRFLVTNDGHIGIGPENALPGDVVYVLAGGHQAYVMRPNPAGLLQPAFTLVGICYLHGIMHGEATRTASRGWTSVGEEDGGNLPRSTLERDVVDVPDDLHEIYLS